METTNNPRQTRGIDIAKRYTIKEENRMWLVPSASGKSNRYKVCLKNQKCTCPDFEIRRQKCKHLFAVEYSFEQDFLQSLDTLQIAKTAKQRKTYPQVWTAYNQAQTNEKSQLQSLLAELCKGIGEPAQTNGRPRKPLKLEPLEQISSYARQAETRLLRSVFLTLRHAP